MAGTSLKMEYKIFEEVPMRWVDPIRKLLNEVEFHNLVEYQQQGIEDSYFDEFPNLNPMEWESIVLKVLFARITAIEVSNIFTLEQVDYLLDLLAICYGKGAEKNTIREVLPREFMHTHEWLNRAFIVRRHKINSKN